MEAVFKTGGKQVSVSYGTRFRIETRSDVQEGKDFTITQVMAIHGGGTAHVGAPYVEKATVTLQHLDSFRDDKVLVFKKKRRNNYRRLNGHRQNLFLVQVKDIQLDGKSLVSDQEKKSVTLWTPLAERAALAEKSSEGTAKKASKKTAASNSDPIETTATSASQEDKKKATPSSSEKSAEKKLAKKSKNTEKKPASSTEKVMASSEKESAKPGPASSGKAAGKKSTSASGTVKE